MIPSSPPERVTVVDYDQMIGDILTTLQHLQRVHWAASPPASNACAKLLEEEFSLMQHLIKVVSKLTTINSADKDFFDQIIKILKSRLENTQHIEGPTSHDNDVRWLAEGPTSHDNNRLWRTENLKINDNDVLQPTEGLKIHDHDVLQPVDDLTSDDHDTLQPVEDLKIHDHNTLQPAENLKIHDNDALWPAENPTSDDNDTLRPADDLKSYDDDDDDTLKLALSLIYLFITDGAPLEHLPMLLGEIKIIDAKPEYKDNGTPTDVFIELSSNTTFYVLKRANDDRVLIAVQIVVRNGIRNVNIIYYNPNIEPPTTHAAPSMFGLVTAINTQRYYEGQLIIANSFFTSYSFQSSMGSDNTWIAFFVMQELSGSDTIVDKLIKSGAEPILSTQTIKNVSLPRNERNEIKTFVNHLTKNTLFTFTFKKIPLPIISWDDVVPTNEHNEMINNFLAEIGRLMRKIRLKNETDPFASLIGKRVIWDDNHLKLESSDTSR